MEWRSSSTCRTAWWLWLQGVAAKDWFECWFECWMSSIWSWRWFQRCAPAFNLVVCAVSYHTTLLAIHVAVLCIVYYKHIFMMGDTTEARFLCIQTRKESIYLFFKKKCSVCPNYRFKVHENTYVGFGLDLKSTSSDVNSNSTFMIPLSIFFDGFLAYSWGFKCLSNWSM